jgi:hypothetical protein
MLDHLKRRCNHLLLTSDSAAAAATPNDDAVNPAAATRSVNIHRTPVKVLLHSSDVRDLLEYWNNRSAFKSEQEISNESIASTSKLSLLVWRAPELQVPLIPTAGATPVRLIKACHVIPVTLQEAAKFQHIPVEMRAGMIPATLRTHIDAKLDALMQHLRPSVAQ